MHARFIYLSLLGKLVQGIIFIGVCSLLWIFIFSYHCARVQVSYVPISPTRALNATQVTSSLSNYEQAMQHTYLSYPEKWFTYNTKEFAAYTTINSPTTYPYFSAIGQYWNNYCQIYGITKKFSQMTASSHVSLDLQGLVFTGKYTLQALYEYTIGKISNSFAVTSPVHIWEQKISSGIEYGFDETYTYISNGVSSILRGRSAATTYAWVDHMPRTVVDTQKDIQLVTEISSEEFIISIPRQSFTADVLMLADKNVHFNEIAGNKEIFVTVIAQTDWQYQGQYGEELFDSTLLTETSHKRMGIQVPVEDLSDTLNYLHEQSIEIEHVYDY